jgi:hypothetical protein
VDVSEGSSILGVSFDTLVESVSSSTHYVGGDMSVDGSVGVYDIVSSDPSIASIIAGSIIRKSSGIVIFSYTKNNVTIGKKVDLRDVSSSTTTYKNQTALRGSLSEHMASAIDELLDLSMTMEDNGNIFSTQDHEIPFYVRNPSFWGASLASALTCCSPWNSNSGSRKAGTLITPRHILGASHYEYNVGAVVRFVAENGECFDRTVVGKKQHPDYKPYYPDLTVYTLDSDLPATIHPANVLPTDINDYLPAGTIRYTRPDAMGLDQEEKGLIVDFYSYPTYDTFIGFALSTNENRSIFHEPKIVGDSGNPVFAIIDGAVCLVTVWTWGGVGGGTPISRHIPDLNQMIIDADELTGISTVSDSGWPNLNGHYQLNAIDLSAFPNFVTKNYIIEDHDLSAGNASMWVENGFLNGKQSYKLYVSSTKHKQVLWEEDAWNVYDHTGDEITDAPVATSYDDVATPDLATFVGEYNFSAPTE